MEFIKLEIPAPDFSFEEIAKDKADFITKHFLYQGALLQFSGGSYDLLPRIEIQIRELDGSGEKLYCIIQLLNSLTEILNQFSKNANVQDIENMTKGIHRIKYKLYSIASKEANYNFDKDAFTTEEVEKYSETIDEIVQKLENLAAGQFFLGEEIQDIKDAKDDFSSLKDQFILGKPIWSKIAKGIIAPFVGKKFLEEAFDQIFKPLFKSLLSGTGIDTLLN